MNQISSKFFPNIFDIMPIKLSRWKKEDSKPARRLGIERSQYSNQMSTFLKTVTCKHSTNTRGYEDLKIHATLVWNNNSLILIGPLRALQRKWIFIVILLFRNLASTERSRTAFGTCNLMGLRKWKVLFSGEHQILFCCFYHMISIMLAVEVWSGWSVLSLYFNFSKHWRNILPEDS